MKGMGSKLRVIRQKWGLTLREVEERSARLAKDWEIHRIESRQPGWIVWKGKTGVYLPQN